MTAPVRTSFSVDGGSLGALVWHGRPKSPIVLCIHGITANAWSWDAVAHRLGTDATVVAVDLRGRGRSAELPGPWGMRQHADDVAAVIRQIEAGPLLVAGHSMGAYVALMTADRHPLHVAGLVLVDGGTPLPIPDDVNVDAHLDATLGPAIARLDTVWPDRVSYLGMWKQHPAFAAGISPTLERTLLADIVETDDGWRTTVDPDAVRADGRELFGDDGVRGLLAAHSTRVPIVRAPFGLMGAPPPLIAEEQLREFDRHEWITVDDANHYTVMFCDPGADIVADTIFDAFDFDESG